MSGGSYDYAYQKIERMADELDSVGGCPSCCAPPELRERFREHLRLVARACRAIEWNDSSDGDDDELALILECLGGHQVRTSSGTIGYALPAVSVAFSELGKAK